jgi:MoxR-like ATPase
MLKTVIDYPKMDEERLVIRQESKRKLWKNKNQLFSGRQILRAQEAVREVYMDEKLKKYILDIILQHVIQKKYKLESLKPLISFGSSPRGSINLATCQMLRFHKTSWLCNSRCSLCSWCIASQNRNYVEAEAENVTSVDIINKIINEIEVP